MATVTVTQWAISFLPVLMLFVCIAFLKLKVPNAALIGLGVALITSALLHELTLSHVSMGISSGVQTAVSILYAIWPAIFLYDIMREAGAFDVISTAVQRLTQDQLIVVLMFSWVLSSFLQSISGFGVPVAVCAPFLVALGIKPIPAVIMTLIGHSWGNTYGTLGMAWDALVSLGPVTDIASTSLYTGILLWILNFSGAVITSFYLGGWKAAVHGLPFIIVMSTIMGGGQTLVGQFDQTTAAFIPTTVAIVVALVLFKLGLFTKPWGSYFTPLDAKTEPGFKRNVALAVFPFVFLALISLVVFNIPFVGERLSRVSLFGISWFKHAGFVLVLTALLAYILMRSTENLSLSAAQQASSQALKKLGGTSAGIILLVILARYLHETGQIHNLALGVAQIAGTAYIPFAPAVGTLGAFVTSSNMSSNILLAGFQNSVASNLGLNASLILAAQTAGGAAGAVIGPSTILLGATTAGAAGKEGEILKPLLVISLSQALVIGLIVWQIFQFQ